jgi:hypothetical protein
MKKTGMEKRSAAAWKAMLRKAGLDKKKAGGRK